MILEKKVIYQNGAIREFEKPEVCEAIKVANENRLTVGLTPTEWDEREARLKKKHEENTKDPDSAENHIKEGSGVNPALAESASQFNDALLDEQADKIKRLGNEITRLNKAIHKKNMKIEELRKESSRHLRGKIKMFFENEDLEQMLKDKNAVLSDVAEELRLSKIREKNLTEVCQKYMKENEELKKKLANKIVDKIDAKALKSAESALAYKEKVIEKLQKQLKYKSPLPSGSVEAINIYVNNISRASRGGFNKSVASTMGETELSETYEYGDKKLKYALHFNEDGSITYECSDPDKKNRYNGDGLPTPEEPKHDNGFKDFINKTIGNYNRRAAELGCAGSKDGNGIFDQMVGADIADKGADHSGVIVLCGKDCIDDIIKKMK